MHLFLHTLISWEEVLKGEGTAGQRQERQERTSLVGNLEKFCMSTLSNMVVVLTIYIYKKYIVQITDDTRIHESILINIHKSNE